MSPNRLLKEIVCFVELNRVPSTYWRCAPLQSI